MKRHLLRARPVDSFIEDLEHMRARITSRAHEIFRRRGEALGSALEDWLTAERQTIWRPAVEVLRTDTSVQIEMAVAGVKPEQLDLKVTRESLLVQADVDHSHKAKGGEVVRCEFEPGRLFRVVDWPAPVNPDGVKAEYRDGMLYVTAPLAAEVQARRVEVHAA